MNFLRDIMSPNSRESFLKSLSWKRQLHSIGREWSYDPSGIYIEREGEDCLIPKNQRYLFSRIFERVYLERWLEQLNNKKLEGEGLYSVSKWV